MKQEHKSDEWFAIWFDSPYYHQLYQNRDYAEADAFVRRIVQQLNLPAGSRVLDLACGKGRHALAMSKLGLDVTGVDLSPESIREASLQAGENLRFAVHDMRDLIPGQRFNAVFNLFTSFGYFESDAENIKVLRAVHEMLLPDGLLLIDFMNVTKVIAHLVAHETKSCGNINFELSRHADGQHIRKQITVRDGEKTSQYHEQVQALTRDKFIQMLHQTGFKLLEEWGSYQLEPFDKQQSDRLILLARKQ